jgi:hypothetical protein
MTRFPHDEFAKGFLESLLSPFGEVQTSFKISSEVREVDVYFQVDRSIQLIPELGLLSPGCKTGIIVIHQLPKTSETLWFRLLGKEKIQSNAIAEVAALPTSHPCRQDALSWLGNLKVILEAREIREPEEEELMMQLSPLFLEKIQAAEQQGEVKGRQEGKTEQGQALVFRLLKRRVGSISIDLETQIKALPLTQLEELGEALLDFSQIEDLVAWLDTNRWRNSTTIQINAIES